MAGWIKLHRSLLDWEWYDDSNTCRLFIHLLLRANHKPKNWRGIAINTGQLLTGRKVLAEQTGLSEQQVRTSLNKLKSTNEITIKSTSHNSLITLVCWESYQQNNQDDNQAVTKQQPTDNQAVTTNKNVKNDNNEKNDKKKPWVSPAGLNLDAWAEFEQHRKDSIEQQATVDKSISSRWAGLFPDKITATKVKDQKAEKREQDANDWANNVQADNHTLGNTFDHGQY